MSRSIFGWDLPPGVTSRMIDEAAGVGQPTELSIERPGYVAYWGEDGEVYCGTDSTEPPKIGTIPFNERETPESLEAQAVKMAQDYADLDAAKKELDPYGRQAFVVGSEDDFVCFDFCQVADRFALAATLNCDTGHFIQEFRPTVVVPRAEAGAAAHALVDAALDWAAENRVRLDMAGWDQDPMYFARAVVAAVEGTHDAKRRVRQWRTS